VERLEANGEPLLTPVTVDFWWDEGGSRACSPPDTSSSFLKHATGQGAPFRGVSLMRKRTPIGPYRRPMPRVRLCASHTGGVPSPVSPSHTETGTISGSMHRDAFLCKGGSSHQTPQVNPLGVQKSFRIHAQPLEGVHVGKYRRSPQHRSSPPSYLPIRNAGVSTGWPGGGGNPCIPPTRHLNQTFWGCKRAVTTGSTAGRVQATRGRAKR